MRNIQLFVLIALLSVAFIACGDNTIPAPDGDTTDGDVEDSEDGDSDESEAPEEETEVEIE